MNCSQTEPNQKKTTPINAFMRAYDNNWIKLPRWFWSHYDIICKRNPLLIRIIYACLNKQIKWWPKLSQIQMNWQKAYNWKWRRQPFFIAVNAMKLLIRFELNEFFLNVNARIYIDSRWIFVFIVWIAARSWI